MTTLLDPLFNFVPRKASAHQVLVALENHANPFTMCLHSSSYKDLLDSRKKLPIFAQLNEFYNMFNPHQVIVIVGETGSGKTTQIPQFVCFSDLPHLNGKLVACTQPRQVAAMSVAKRVAKEMDVSLGKEVGYSIRFEDMTEPGTTFLKYLADDMLLREAMADPDLQQYSTIIIDEAHERSLATDILMGLLKMVLRRRPDLKLIIMSATLDAAKFRKHFSLGRQRAPLFTVLGRAFPVEIFHTQEPQPDYLEAAVRTVLMVHRVEDPGDILLFLCEEEEIQDACKRIAAEADELINQDPDNVGPLVCLPLHSSLPPQQLQRVFEPPLSPQLRGGPPARKVIISTNIAETSLTIDGIVYVVDPGFSQLKVYNPRIRVESLLNTPISKASAQQRAGRAGRTRPGKCFRLYTEKDFVSELEAQNHPEILCCNLAHTVLELAKLGIEDLIHFDYIDAPAPEALMRAFELLNFLGALDDNGALTPLGAMMAEFPLDPQMARTLIASPGLDCSHEILTIIAMLNGSSPDVWLQPNDQRAGANCVKQLLAIAEGDHLSLMNVYNAYQQNKDNPAWAWNNNLSQQALAQAEKIRTQLVSIMERLDLPTIPNINSSPASQSGNIQRALVCGYFMQVAHKEGGTDGYITVKDNQVVLLHPSCALDPAPEWVLFNEFILTTRPYIRTVTAIRAEWLLDLAPEYFDLKSFSNCAAKQSLERAKKKTKGGSSTGTGKRAKRGRRPTPGDDAPLS